MKYIRTKDSIYKVVGKNENGYNINTKPFLKVKNERYFLHPFISKENAADTIEELCDTFVIKIGTGYLINDYYDKKLLTQAIQNDGEVYGAIWTDKGLIYVAKINEKGELELL